ncbi:MAG: threonine synthase [Gemmatimonadetes bacterium]|nr:threonine synthase [Gemmatimonadota bacterium]
MSTTLRVEQRLRCRLCGEEVAAGPFHVCEYCFGPLEVMYDKGEPGRPRLTRERIAARPPDLWRYRELLPITEEPRVGHGVGFTPLVPAPRLGERLGIDDLWLKNDGACHPTLSFKDRVVAVAIQKALEFGMTTVGCASTGNLANAVAAHAAAAGLQAWIFIPQDLEREKIVATAVYAPRLVRIRGVYDDVNRLCAEVADRYGWGIVNVNLRPYYAEGSKTVAFEIAEQLGWRAPGSVVAPMAGGSLLTKLHKGFAEMESLGLAPGGGRVRCFGAQAAGCAPIVEAFHRGDTQVRPVRPNTIARSLAIGNPADGPFALEAMRKSGGWAESASDPEIADAIQLLAEREGIFTETAGGTVVAAARKLAAAGRFQGAGPTVLCITGNGLKTPDAVSGRLDSGPVIDPRLAQVADLLDSRSKA